MDFVQKVKFILFLFPRTKRNTCIILCRSCKARAKTTYQSLISLTMKIEININENETKSEQNTFLYILGNIINLPFALAEAFTWAICGVLWCITIIGIPFGVQCFKMAQLALWPFGKTVVLKNDSNVSLFFNIFWLFFTGLEMAIIYLFEGIVLCITLIGIPWGLQKFKMAKLALLPFGAEIN